MGVQVKNLYTLDVENCATLRTKSKKVQRRDISELWHRIFGYLHHRALKIMQKISKILPKGTLEQRDTCKGCRLGKYTKYFFHDKDNRAQAILDQVHSNVCGSLSRASTTKHRYYVIFIDDISRKFWIFFM